MSKTRLIIHGWLMQSTLKFLRLESPHLCDYLAATQNNPPVQNVYRDDRHAILASYELVMTYAEAFAIYSTVEISRQQYGNHRQFEGMSLYALAAMWRDFVEKLDEIAAHPCANAV